MKKIIIFLFLLYTVFCKAQIDTSSLYPNLKRFKTYQVSLEDRGNSSFKVNGNFVSREIYEKYKKVTDLSWNCCPCIVKTYDINETLLSESVKCGDCGVGWFKTYYSSGQIQLIGKYKENNTGDWSNIFNRAYCYVPNGQWTYFDKEGKITYIEVWKDGEFIKQLPKQKTNELWKMDVVFNGKSILYHDTLSMEEVKKLEFIPRYKNGTKLNDIFEIECNISVAEEVYQRFENKKRYNFRDFKNIDFPALIKQQNVPKNGIRIVNIDIFLNNKKIRTVVIHLKE